MGQQVQPLPVNSQLNQLRITSLHYTQINTQTWHFNYMLEMKLKGIKTDWVNILSISLMLKRNKTTKMIKKNIFLFLINKYPAHKDHIGWCL